MIECLAPTSPQGQSLVAENQNAKPNHLLLQLSSVGISEPKRAPCKHEDPSPIPALNLKKERLFIIYYYFLNHVSQVGFELAV